MCVVFLVVLAVLVVLVERSDLWKVRVLVGLKGPDRWLGGQWWFVVRRAQLMQAHASKTRRSAIGSQVTLAVTYVERH